MSLLLTSKVSLSSCCSCLSSACPQYSGGDVVWSDIAIRPDTASLELLRHSSVSASITVMKAQADLACWRARAYVAPAGSRARYSNLKKEPCSPPQNSTSLSNEIRIPQGLLPRIWYGEALFSLRSSISKGNSILIWTHKNKWHSLLYDCSVFAAHPQSKNRRPVRIARRRNKRWKIVVPVKSTSTRKFRSAAEPKKMRRKNCRFDLHKRQGVQL